MAVIIFLSPTLVYATTIYLSCGYLSDKETKSFTVKLDEDSKNITHTWNDGGGFNAEGVFSANSISYQKVFMLSPASIIDKYEIDRSDLRLKKVSTVGDSEKFEYFGNCDQIVIKKQKI